MDDPQPSSLMGEGSTTRWTWAQPLGLCLRYSLTTPQGESQSKAWQSPEAERRALIHVESMAHCASNGLRTSALDNRTTGIN